MQEGYVVQLLITVAQSIIEVFLVSLVGYFLARRGILSSNVRKSINRLNVSLFTPALLFSKVAFSLTPDKLADLVIIPIGFAIVTMVSMACAWALAKVFRLKKSQSAFAIACAGFPNSNSLPVALMQSLIVSVSDLKWGPDDTQDEMLGRALSYLVLFSTLGIILRWSVGVKLLSVADDAEPVAVDESAQPKTVLNGSNPNALVQSPPVATPEETPLLIDQDVSKHRSIHFPDGERESVEHTNPGSIEATQRKKQSQHTYFNSFPNTPTSRTPAASSRGSSASSDEEGDDEDDPFNDRHVSGEESEWGAERGVGNREGTKPSRSKMQVRMRKVRKFCVRWIWRPLKKLVLGIKAFMTVPLYAAVLSLIVCCIPPVQHFLDELQPLRGALTSAGNCSIPLTLVVLGGFMHEEDNHGPEAKKKSSVTETAPSKPGRVGSRPRQTKRTSLRKSVTPSRPGETRTVIVAILSRMVVAPAILLPALWWYSLGENGVQDDPVFVVTACLAIGSPPALTLAQITDAASGDAFERLISKTMLWAYALVTPPTTVLLCLLGLIMDKSDR